MGHSLPRLEGPIRLHPPTLLALAACAIVSVGCFPDDWDGQPYEPPTTSVPTTVPTVVDSSDTGAPALDPLVGRWVSEGSDLSDLFANFPFEYERIEATFGADGSVVTEIVDAKGDEYVTTGRWERLGNDQPAAIALNQVEPYEATLAGIYSVQGDELTYEVVQIQPDYGYTPPTPDSGFGTTAGPNLTQGINVQYFERAR